MEMASGEGCPLPGWCCQGLGPALPEAGDGKQGTLGGGWLGRCLPLPSWGGAAVCSSSRPPRCGGAAPHPACPLRRRLTVSEQVRGRAEEPWGQVPGQLLQLTQQTFHFNLQVLHRLLHRLGQREMGAGAVGARADLIPRSSWPPAAGPWCEDGAPCSGPAPPASQFPDDRIPGVRSPRPPRLGTRRLPSVTVWGLGAAPRSPFSFQDFATSHSFCGPAPWWQHCQMTGLR